MYDTEEGYDYLHVYYSWDRVNWIPLEYHEGYSGGWEYPACPITKSGNTLYLRFQFYSDYVQTGYGVYLDDVEVTGDPVPKPNLVPYWPAFWSGPIVASPVTGTNQSATVYGGEPAYIDFAVRNSGDAEAGSFYCGLYVDGSLVMMLYVGGLYVAEWRELEDHNITLGTGLHTLKVVVDEFGDIAESNETDNEYTTYFTWYEPTISLSGLLQFWDMNPPAHLENLCGVKVELRDQDASGSELLETDWTGDDGRFWFPSHTNRETNGDGQQQDIFLRIFAVTNAARVTPSQSGSDYSYDTQVVPNHRSGDFDTSVAVPQSPSGYFYPTQIIRESSLKWMQVRSDPGQVHLVLGSYGTYTDPNTMLLYIDNSETPSNAYPDTYDKDVINHEYGHWLSDRFAFLDEGGGVHSWRDTTSLETAATEAFGHFFCAWTKEYPLTTNRYNGFTSSFERNVENGEWGFDGYVDSSANNWGAQVEAAVAGILWDIYDSQSDDYSTFGQMVYPHYGDGIGDTLSDGIGNILTALMDRSAIATIIC